MHSILAARTDFSIGESIIKAEMLIDQAVLMGEKAVAITDTMSVTALIDFSNRAKKAGIKPVIGTRLRFVNDAAWRKTKGVKEKTPPSYYLTAYALSEAGLKSLYRLLTLANSDSHFYFEPKLGFEDLYKELKIVGTKDLAIHLGDTNGMIAHPEAGKFIANLKKLGMEDSLYAALVPIDTPYFAKINKLGVESGLKPLTVRPAFYLKDEADAAEIMGAISNNTKISSMWHLSTHNRDFHAMGLSELASEALVASGRLSARGVAGAGAAFKLGLKNTEELVDKVTYVWSKSPVSLPIMAADEFATLREKCAAGWKVRFKKETFGHLPADAELKTVYIERLKYELGVIKTLDFSGYFLLVEDVVNFAKSSGILVGPGRGSVGGSLIAYLLGITDCDPIRFGLLFERFINPDRIDLPDVDLDFMSERRHEITDYLVTKYGRERVAGVSNYGTLAAASAIRDVSRMVGIDAKDARVSMLVPKLHGANVSLPDSADQVEEIKLFAEKYEESWWPMMVRLEGTMRSMGQHAAGVIVGGVDLVDRGVIEHRKDARAMCWDKRIVEDQGLIKMDILGLLTLDLIHLTKQYIMERTGKDLDILDISLDDKDVLDNFAAGNTTGVFQFESGGMRRLLKELGSDGVITFEDITAATALYRPGPMESGMMESYYRRKQGGENVTYDHPILEDVLKSTYGVFVYQEQVMKASRVIAGYTGPEADTLRKIMGKKEPAKMALERDKFVKGCVATIACTEEWGGQLFDKIEGFAGYGFNRSHSVEYSLISWQCMYLKTHFSSEFFAAALTLLDQDKLVGLIKDAGRFGIEVSMPDINVSSERFEIATDVRLVIPFNRIKGIAKTTTDAIIAARAAGPFKNMADFLLRVDKRKCNVRHQGALDTVGAFSRIELTQLPANDPSRIREQLDLLPGLISANVPIHHEMHKDKVTKEALSDVVNEYRSAHGPNTGDDDGQPVKPSIGKDASFMLIVDAPNAQEEGMGLMSFSKSTGCVIDAMAEHDLSRNDVYWTGLIKRPKGDKQVSAAEIFTYKKYLEDEIRILNPPIIVLMGSQAVRHFMPDFKGKASDAAGKVVYSKEHDANFVIGFNPGEIYFAPEKQAQMVDVFKSVEGLLNG
ncbi:MAG: DNA polymerase III subunit alpha [Undibacterium sp.]